jgi:hypothetical protein
MSEDGRYFIKKSLHRMRQAFVQIHDFHVSVSEAIIDEVAQYSADMRTVRNMTRLSDLNRTCKVIQAEEYETACS